MWSALLVVLLGASPVCSDQVHFSWPSSAFTSVSEDGLSMQTFAWVRAARDAFVIELPGGRVLVARRAKAPAVSTVDGWKVEQTALRLPLVQGEVMLTEAGGGVGCVVMVKGRDLGGPIASQVILDARLKWTFELRDRSMKQQLLAF